MITHCRISLWSIYRNLIFAFSDLSQWCIILSYPQRTQFVPRIWLCSSSCQACFRNKKNCHRNSWRQYTEQNSKALSSGKISYKKSRFYAGFIFAPFSWINPAPLAMLYLSWFCNCLQPVHPGDTQEMHLDLMFLRHNSENEILVHGKGTLTCTPFFLRKTEGKIFHRNDMNNFMSAVITNSGKEQTQLITR